MSVAREQLYAVLITLHQDVLLLPNAAVAEVLAREALQAGGAGDPDWLAGYCNWNNLRVPVLRFERLNRGQAAQGSDSDPRRERVVIFSALGRHLPGGHLAFVTQGYPHLVTLNRTAVRSAPLRTTDRDELVLARVRIANQEAVIPDLERIEMEIARVSVPGSES